MEEILNRLLENSSLPFLSAFVLGLMTAISPCPLATNITAIGFIGKDIENRKRVFINGFVYTLGRAITYTFIAVVIFLGADKLSMSGIFQKYGEKIIGPLLIVIGLFMLDILKIKLPGVNKLTRRFGENGTKNYSDVLMLGILFALAFCPYSAVMYFGMLIPITITSPAGLYLPVVFAIATAIPVIIFAWLIAFTISKVGVWYNHLKVFEIWFRRLVSIVFIGVGIYYVFTIYF